MAIEEKYFEEATEDKHEDFKYVRSQCFWFQIGEKIKKHFLTNAEK